MGTSSTLSGRENQAYLGDEVVSEFNITGHFMGHVVGGNINESLNLMNHGICVGHLLPVLHAGAALSANHTVNLFLNFSWLGAMTNVEIEKSSRVCVGLCLHNFTPIILLTISGQVQHQTLLGNIFVFYLKKKPTNC